ncbi:MAG TPA: cell division protein FtsQ/DivIB [Candidatus Avalokitesvara rifleensis]|uniref:cell division protein FtsQ/DivIB n=1 Tax=Candidatus Avalokitesvara rifleensis TaxID=3367620 RepID=UPI0027135961|nr:cell division protein FtsQ/DivIB [Candidatus Brocadiales bacterium]
MKAIARDRNVTKIERFKAAIDSIYFHVSILVLCVGLIGWATYEGWRQLTVLDDFTVREVSFTVFPTDGIKPGLLKEVRNSQGLIGRNLFETNLTRKVAEKLERNSWVLKVHSVKRVFPDKLSVNLELRGPSAVLRKNGTFYLLDDEGVVLPDGYYSWPLDQGNTPYIQSVHIRKTPRAGECLDDPGIKAGIELVKFLKKNNAHRLLGVKVVDVSNVGLGRTNGESDIVLWTKDGMAIKWGCPVECQQTNELSDSEKLKNLYSVVKAEGSKLDHMEYVDVRWKAPRGKLR